MEKVIRGPAPFLPIPSDFTYPSYTGPRNLWYRVNWAVQKLESTPRRLPSPFASPLPPPPPCSPRRPNATPAPPSRPRHPAPPPRHPSSPTLCLSSLSRAACGSVGDCSLTFRPAPGGGESRSARRHRSPPSDADGSLPEFSRVYAQWPVSKGLSTEAGVFDTTSAGSSLAATIIEDIPIRKTHNGR